MSQPIRIAIIGLDTSHSVEFPRRMQAPDCPDALRVTGMRAVTCLRFPSPFQAEAGQDKRQAQLEAWGVRLVAELEEAVRDADAIMLEINDPAPHLAWFEKVAPLGKPVFIDKPLADTARAGAQILELARRHNVRVASCSALRSDAALIASCAALPRPTHTAVYGALGKAPVGSSVVWYGVHAVEMLQRAMGSGAVAVTARRDATGVTAVVDYADRRRGVVELTEGAGIYGGTLRNSQSASAFSVNAGAFYSKLLGDIERFFRGGEPPASLDDALEVLAILDAAERSQQSSRTEPVLR